MSIKPASKKATSNKARKAECVTIYPELVKIGPLPTIFKTEDHELQLNGSYMKEDTMYKHSIDTIHNTELRPLVWFRMFAGQLIYAVSEKGFNGYLEVTTEEHAEKLCKAQEKGYRFHSLVGIGKRFYEAEIGSQEEQVSETDIEEAREDALTAVGQYVVLFMDREYNLIDLLYAMLGFNDWEWNIWESKAAITSLMRAICKPKINEALKAELREGTLVDLSNLLGRLHEFFDNLDNEEQYKAVLTQHHLRQHTTAKDKSAEQWRTIENTYDNLKLAKLIQKG
jgi:hypothetical protein